MEGTALLEFARPGGKQTCSVSQLTWGTGALPADVRLQRDEINEVLEDIYKVAPSRMTGDAGFHQLGAFGVPRVGAYQWLESLAHGAAW